MITSDKNKNETIDLYHGKNCNRVFFSPKSLKFYYLLFGIGFICLGRIDNVLYTLTSILNHNTQRIKNRGGDRNSKIDKGNNNIICRGYIVISDEQNLSQSCSFGFAVNIQYHAQDQN